MADVKICENCAKEGKVGIMTKSKENDFAPPGTGSGSSYECDRCKKSTQGD